MLSEKILKALTDLEDGFYPNGKEGVFGTSVYRKKGVGFIIQEYLGNTSKSFYFDDNGSLNRSFLRVNGHRVLDNIPFNMEEDSFYYILKENCDKYDADLSLKNFNGTYAEQINSLPSSLFEKFNYLENDSDDFSFVKDIKYSEEELCNMSEDLLSDLFIKENKSLLDLIEDLKNYISEAEVLNIVSSDFEGFYVPIQLYNILREIPFLQNSGIYRVSQRKEVKIGFESIDDLNLFQKFKNYTLISCDYNLVEEDEEIINILTMLLYNDLVETISVFIA